MKNLLFSDVECCWRQFWQAEENSPLDEGEEERSVRTVEVFTSIEMAAFLSNRSFSTDINLTGLNRTQLYTMCTLQPVLEYIQTMDFHFYQVIADVLIPNVLKPIPSTLTQSIRNFAKRLENALAVALQGAPEVVVKIKVCFLLQNFSILFIAFLNVDFFSWMQLDHWLRLSGDTQALIIWLKLLEQCCKILLRSVRC